MFGMEAVENMNNRYVLHSGICGFPGFIKVHFHPFALKNATLIGF